MTLPRIAEASGKSIAILADTLSKVVEIWRVIRSLNNVVSRLSYNVNKARNNVLDKSLEPSLANCGATIMSDARRCE